jgi:hypothetical protein
MSFLCSRIYARVILFFANLFALISNRVSDWLTDVCSLRIHSQSVLHGNAFDKYDLNKNEFDAASAFCRFPVSLTVGGTSTHETSIARGSWKSAPLPRKAHVGNGLRIKYGRRSRTNERV